MKTCKLTYEEIMAALREASAREEALRMCAYCDPPNAIAPSPPTPDTPALVAAQHGSR